jgi:hypothetical protein
VRLAPRRLLAHALPERGALRRKHLRGVVQGERDGVVERLVPRGHQRRQRARGEVLEAKRCRKLPLRSLVRQRIAQYVGEHAHALDDRCRPMARPAQAPERERALAFAGWSYRHRQVRAHLRARPARLVHARRDGQLVEIGELDVAAAA